MSAAASSGSWSGPSMFSPIPASAFHAYVESLSRAVPSLGGADGFDAELSALHSLQSSPSALSAVYVPTAAEAHKNRYCDVLPNAASRVRLRAFASCHDSDYLNASLVPPDAFSFPAYPYIAAQAPLPSCVAAWWHMAWEQRCQLVLMLTKERERGKDDAMLRKADRYWPTEHNQPTALGPLTLTLTHTAHLSTQQIAHYTDHAPATDALHALLAPPAPSSASGPSPPSVQSCPPGTACEVVVRVFELRCSGEVRAVWQVQYVGWPDHGVPSDLGSFASFFRLYRSLRSACPRSSPVVVHCSAGIGRTGTLCTVDLALDQLAHTAADTASTAQPARQAAVSVANTVRLLRASRPGMVQTKGQYQFCYRFIDHCIQRGDLMQATSAQRGDAMPQSSIQ